jgi:hypothetical protein
MSHLLGTPLLVPIRNMQVAEAAMVGATFNRGTVD